MSKTRKLISYSASLATVIAANPGRALAQGLNDTVGIAPSDTRFTGLNSIRPSNFVAAVINIFLGAAGVVAFIFLLWGGLQWILAGGDKEGTEKARKKITSALIGLAIVFSAYALLFIIRALFGIDLIAVNLNRIY